MESERVFFVAQFSIDWKYLGDHPRNCKWLKTMVIASPLSRVVGPLPNGRFMSFKRGLLTTYWDEPPSTHRVSFVYKFIYIYIE